MTTRLLFRFDSFHWLGISCILCLKQGNPEKASELQEVEEHYEIDRRRIERDLESTIERVKNG